MKFDDLDTKMRAYEKSLDQIIPEDRFMLARLDGRGFSKLTKEVGHFQKPFDIRFRDLMINTVKQLMDCGFRVLYGYTQSDEITLLFAPDETTFGRKVRKFNSVLAGVAAAAFTLQFGKPAVFDCRIIPLPDEQAVCDCFLWRQEDACRNALNSYCYWTLRQNGASVHEATKTMDKQTVAFKKELLARYGIDFDQTPRWQRFGTGLRWKTVEKEGFNPISGETVTVQRKTLAVDTELPVRQEYAEEIKKILRDAT